MLPAMDLDPTLCWQAMLARDARFDGRFFIAVRSTGIYCRPICPAQHPKAENCTFLPSAAAAQEAGFRPCLRCRPETAPGLGAWLGTSNTVARALGLIETGALDQDGSDALALRVGVGERHLRRLFMRHLGASPPAVAQTRRVLLAKQLLHETDLSMTAVALAAGFGSVRRFNEVFQALFGRPPASLRRAGGNQAPGSAITLSLGYRPPYDWAAVIGFLSARAIPGVETVENGTYVRTVEIDGHAGTVAVAQEPSRNRLRATILFPQLNALPVIVARLRRMFDLAADPDVIDAALSQDARLAPLVAARPGLRVPGAWDGFELAVRAVVGQQVSVGAATRLAGRIVREHGPLFPGVLGQAGLSHLFPRPQALAGAGMGGMPAARSRAVAALASAAAADPELFERGPHLGASVEKLLAQPGIGEWTAHYVAMRAMREPDAFPAADIGLMRAMDDGAGRPTATALLERAECWRPWRAYAAIHLWAADTARTPRELTEAPNALAA